MMWQLKPEVVAINARQPSQCRCYNPGASLIRVSPRFYAARYIVVLDDYFRYFGNPSCGEYREFLRTLC